jgi:hypothetical protein
MTQRESPGIVAFPFSYRRSSDVMKGMEYVTTRETVHGLLRYGVEGLVMQWRMTRSREVVGSEIRTDRSIEEVREVTVPAGALAAARVRWLWWRWPPGRYLVLTASDLRAFEEIAGAAGLQLDHPAELALPIGRGELLAAREFAGEIELAAADRALREAEREQRLPPGSPADRG